MTILAAGLTTYLVDAGRPRTRSLGIPLGGAADRTSLALGNALVGNPPHQAALEVCLAGPTLIADADLACVLFGAPFEIRGLPGVRVGVTFTLPAHRELRILGSVQHTRAYLCVRGGIHGATILGSQSSLAPLPAGTRLTCSAGHIPRRFLPDNPCAVEPEVLHVLPGAQADWFPREQLEQTTFRLGLASNRMGLRLQSSPLPIPAREIVSEPVCPGTVQVTREGQCIILGVDGQTIGGYPKIAQVIAADLDKLGQLRPGEQVRFRWVSLAEAEERRRQQQRMLRHWLLRLQVADIPD